MSRVLPMGSFRPQLRRCALLCLTVPALLQLSACHTLRAGDDSWDSPPAVVRRVEAAKAAERRYARQLERELGQLLSTALPADALRLRVYLQLDFDQSWQSERLVAEDQRLLEQRSSTQKTETGSDEQVSDERVFAPAGAESTVIYHPGRIQQLGMVLLVDQRRIGEADPRLLEEQLRKLLMAASPYREERGDRIEIQFLLFVD